MAAYQCLNCHQIEHGEEDCCGRPDLFCINDMPGEILRLRAALQEIAKLHGVWSNGMHAAGIAKTALKE